MSTVLIPLPDRDFDPTEVAVSWHVLTRAGIDIVFATESGKPAIADELMVTGRGLDVWSKLPGLDRVVVVGRPLRANADARVANALLRQAPEFQRPISWSAVTLDGVDGLLLPGGHRARGMRSYLESERLQRLVAEAFTRDVQVAAICHGVLLAARSKDPQTGQSVLFGRKTTALTWALERRAWQLARIARFWDPDYYRTYLERPGQPAGYMSVQAEVTRALEKPSDFRDVPVTSPNYRVQASGTRRDSASDSRPAFVVDDGNYLSARWPGDVHTFATQFAEKLAASAAARAAG